MANPMYGQNQADDRVAVACDKDVLLKEYTATAAVGDSSGKYRVIELNHASTVINITGMHGVDYAGQMVVITDTSASGTAAHTVTLTTGTFDGTNNKVTLNAPKECIMVFFDSAGNGTIMENVGSVALASV